MGTVRKKKVHAVMSDNACRCLNCGDEYVMNMPGSIGIMLAIIKTFSKEHRRCKPSERGRKRFEFNTPMEWIISWDTGISSKTIWMIMTGKTVNDYGSPPRDPSDFGRCYRLLEKFTEWKPRLSEVSARFTTWEPYIAAWPELTALYEEELPQGTAPKLYARLKQLEEQGKNADTTTAL